ncbi:C40 family peptidase [Pontibacter korlensis]|uniref:NlpC/P60 domain-containing protein n=1 Tax=Pontibacter korlensis TaxID=400092 RepID=A0A0E3ZIC1_9BACT|nr:C40 family peptidase [Pontibacter korlensis]AKD04564.1 hypothetical protein PKOR_17515 [Pontibacter korlensis]
MKKNVLIILSPIVLLALLVLFRPSHFTSATSSDTLTTPYTPSNEVAIADITAEPDQPEQLELVEYAMRLVGSPYVWAGETPEGFDCSGFITHVYDKYNIDLPHSSGLQAEEGNYLPREEARAGDLVIFTGTNPEVREPGHVGIVISGPSDTIEFVHSSSNGGVKVSQVEGSRYDLRFLQVRRIL